MDEQVTAAPAENTNTDGLDVQETAVADAAVEGQESAAPSKMTLEYIRSKGNLSAEESYLLSEIASRNKEAKNLRDRAKSAESTVERHRQLFPQLDEMTPEQLMSQVEERDARIAELEAAGRAKDIDIILGKVCSDEGADRDVVQALLSQNGFLDGVSLDDPAGATLEVAEAVKGLLVEKPFLAGAKPGASPASGTGATPGVSYTAGSDAQYDKLISEGKFKEAADMARSAR